MQESKVLQPQFSWCSWSSLGVASHGQHRVLIVVPPSLITAQRHHTHIPHALTNMDNLNFDSFSNILRGSAETLTC